jgi:transposase, IS30 family
MTDSFHSGRPGRGKPLTAKRELYFRLMRQGLSSSEACRQVGINRRTGKRWRYGRRVLVNGRVYTYGPISAAPSMISARFLSEQERLHIADLHRLGRSIRAIARKMGRAASTISRELCRNADPTSGAYHPYAAHRRAAGRRAWPRPAKPQISSIARAAGWMRSAQRTGLLP